MSLDESVVSNNSPGREWVSFMRRDILMAYFNRSLSTPAAPRATLPTCAVKKFVSVALLLR